LEGRIFSSQSELFENFSNCSDWLEKVGPIRKPLLFLSCKQAIYVQNRSGFLEGRLFSSHSEYLKNFQKALIGWKKADPSNKPLIFRTCKPSTMIYQLQNRKN